jgi:5-methylcytosine-specific restriction endonuclease McrBC GTP-binding regulatory subunit McrB
MNGNIYYEFIPGPFTRILTQAFLNPTQSYTLIIEELNRAKADSVFGDIFQLLDRTNDYHITPSKELKEYLTAQFAGNQNIDGNKLILPPNLNILATMNTSDQSLFPMDSAFKRRWDWHYIPIDYDDAKKFKIDLESEGEFNWGDLINVINKIFNQFITHYNLLKFRKS